MKTISRQQARELVDNRDDLTVVEVLGEDQFNRFHLPGAHNVPLGDSFAENIRKVAPEPGAPVLLYCRDAECDASPKAAKTMEQMGYTRVFDYEAGKADWKEAGLPIEEPSAASA